MDLYSTDIKRSTISLTPLIDMVFLLVVFFMLTATFHKNQGIELGFSADTPTQTAGDLKSIIIAVNGNGDILLDDRSHNINSAVFAKAHRRQFQQQIGVLLAKNPIRPIQIFVIGDATVQNVINAIDLIQQAGGSNITFIDENL